MSKPKISVIIPCYNQGLYLWDAINSVLDSDYENFEIIVVNDGSTDPDTVKIISEISHPKIKILNQTNQGVPSARNNGIKMASGDYILPLDADDKIHKTYLGKAVEILDNNSEIGLVYSNFKTFQNENRLYCPVDYNAFPKKILANTSMTASAIFRAKDFYRVGGYKDEMRDGPEDWEFWISLYETGVKWHKIQEALFFYRKYDEETLSTKFKNKAVYWKSYKKTLKLHSDSFIDNLEYILPEVFLVAMNQIPMRDKISFTKRLIFRAIKPKNLFRTVKQIIKEKINIFSCLIEK